jgi:hypothetical protein
MKTEVNKNALIFQRVQAEAASRLVQQVPIVVFQGEYNKLVQQHRKSCFKVSTIGANCNN